MKKLSKTGEKRWNFFMVSMYLLLFEVLIARTANHFIRCYVGDVLIVILIYTFIRCIIPEGIKRLPVYIFLFACGVEILQFFQIVKVLGLEDNPFLSIVIGTTFDWKDILCYGIGCLFLEGGIWIKEKCRTSKIFNGVMVVLVGVALLLVAPVLYLMNIIDLNMAMNIGRKLVLMGIMFIIIGSSYTALSGGKKSQLAEVNDKRDKYNQLVDDLLNKKSENTNLFFAVRFSGMAMYVIVFGIIFIGSFFYVGYMVFRNNVIGWQVLLFLGLMNCLLGGTFLYLFVGRVHAVKKEIQKRGYSIREIQNDFNDGFRVRVGTGFLNVGNHFTVGVERRNAIVIRNEDIIEVIKGCNWDPKSNMLQFDLSFFLKGNDNLRDEHKEMICNKKDGSIALEALRRRRVKVSDLVPYVEK